MNGNDIMKIRQEHSITQMKRLAEAVAERDWRERQEDFKRMMAELSKSLQRQMRECRGEK